MTLPSNGITPDVIRDLMPPYHLSQDLLTATFACIPPPPPEATTAQRHARITRLLQEIAAQKPADADQARIATQVLVARELADSVAARAHAPNLEINQLCRLARSTAELQRSANALARTLTCHQQKPVPFYGTVEQDEVDIQAIDAQWASRTPPQAEAGAAQPRAAKPKPTDPAPPNPAPPPTQAKTAPPNPPSNPPDTAPQPAVAEPPPPPTQPPAPTPPTTNTTPPPAPTPETRPASSDPTTEWTITRLDSGPGWTREVLRHRSATAAPDKAAAR